MSNKLQHAPLVQFPIVDDELIVGGVRLSQLAEQIGQTPFYAYDREAISRRVHALREKLPAEISLHYAIKANPMPAVVDHLAALVDGLDIASIGELRVALDSGESPANISFAGPGKDDVELRGAVAAGITVNLESANEYRRVLEIGHSLGATPRVAIRTNPDFELKASGMKMSGGPKPFGIDVESVPALLNRIEVDAVDFRGFHIFSGSQSLRAESLIEAQDATFELAYRLAQGSTLPVETLNIGGGFGVPYFPGDKPLELGAISDNLQRHLGECRERLGACEVILELGRYLVAEAGVYVSRVVDRKHSRGQIFLVTDGGLHHHLAASGNLGQAVRRNYPVVNARQVHGGARETVNISGRLCTPIDVLGHKIDVGKAEVGDLVVILQSGAYGYSASPHLFLGHPPPKQVLV